MTILQHRTATAWTAANPTLASGEAGYETDTRREKIGDGVTAWNSLPYVADAVGAAASQAAAAQTAAITAASADATSKSNAAQAAAIAAAATDATTKAAAARTNAAGDVAGLKATANGLASLDGTGKLPTAQLPTTIDGGTP